MGKDKNEENGETKKPKSLPEEATAGEASDSLCQEAFMKTKKIFPKTMQQELDWQTQAGKALQEAVLHFPKSAMDLVREHESAYNLVLAMQSTYTNNAFDDVAKVLNNMSSFAGTPDVNLSQSAMEMVKGMDVGNRYEQMLKETLKSVPPQFPSYTNKLLNDAVRGFTAGFSQTLFDSQLADISKMLQSASVNYELAEWMAEEEKRYRNYNESPVFWKNVKRVSKKLVSLPQDVSDAVLDYLCEESCDVQEVKRMIGDGDVNELKTELQDQEHADYKFKGYLEEILNLYNANPESYRVFIPALFAIIEGTLSETFKTSKKSMSYEIKRKMTVVWDLYHYVYMNQSVEGTFIFRNKLYLKNIQEMFRELTGNSSNQGGSINRNATLHGKSNPDDWKHEDFTTLINLLQTILFARKTIDILLTEFVDILEDDECESDP